MRSLIYLQPMSYPGDQTQGIQITRTVAELGKHTNVTFVIGEETVPLDHIGAAIEDRYGLSFGPGVRLVAIARKRFGGFSFPLALREVLASAPADAVFYTRSFPIARRLIRYRWLHRRLVFLETHKKMGYLKEDPVPGSRYHRIRERFERTNDARWRIKRLYSSVDCLFVLHRHSLEVIRREQSVRDSEHLWYGCLPPPARPTPGHGVGYCGSIAEHKLIDLLLDALDLVATEVVVSVYGGEPDRVDALKRQVTGRPAADRIHFLGRLGHRELQQRLAGYRFGVALQEGLKVVDYLENGLVPIVPDIPSYRDELDGRNAIMFSPDDPASLAACLDTASSGAVDPQAGRLVLERNSIAERARKILERLS